MKKFTKKEISDAIKDSRGIMSVVADRLGCEWHTAQRHIDAHKLTQQMENENDSMCDYAESALFKKIEAGDVACIIFYLKTKGRHRGYVEKIDHSGEFKHKHDINMDQIIKSMNEKG